MGINLKNDYGYLFNNLNSDKNGNQSGNIFHSINLAEYHSIKSGAYGKAVSSYFEKQKAEGNNVHPMDVNATDKEQLLGQLSQQESVQNLTDIMTEASKFTDAAEKLTNRGPNSLFNKEDGEFDREEIYKAVADFAEKFNNFMLATKEPKYKTIEQKVDDIKKKLEIYKDEMKNIGISVDDQTYNMNVAYDEFMKADMNAVRELFNGNTSMAYVLAMKTSFVGAEAKTELNTMKNYKQDGGYENGYHLPNYMDHMI